MKKLLPEEQAALDYLEEHGPLVPNEMSGDVSALMVVWILDQLVRKKCATSEPTDIPGVARYTAVPMVRG